MPKYKAYVVTVGTEPGVYSNWLDVLERVYGISEARYCGFKQWDDAVESFQAIYARGETRSVSRPLPPAGRGGNDGGGRAAGPRQQLDARRSAKSIGTSSTADDHSERLAQIVSALANLRPEAKSVEGGVKREWAGAKYAQPGAPSTSRNGLKMKRATTALPQSRPQRGPLQTVPCRSAQSLHVAPRPVVQPHVTVGPSISSSPPTAVTQTKNLFSSRSGSRASPKYAQSISYASSPRSQSGGLRTPTIASSDWRSHLSSPSSLGTMYFPEDWLARQTDKAANAPRSASPALSDNATNGRAVRHIDRSTVSPSVVSYVTRTPRSIAASFFVSTQASIPPSTVASAATTTSGISGKRGTRLSKSRNDAAVQTESQNPRRKRIEATTQTSSPSKKLYVEGSVQTSQASSAASTPLRESTVVGGIPIRASATGTTCVCEHPEHLCLSCGLRTRVMQSVANSPVALSQPTSSSLDGSVMTSGSQASFATPPARTPSQSVRTSIGRKTPNIAFSEASTRGSPAHNEDAGWGRLTFSETARGAEAVVHDTVFDPRSPIQRGTSIPAGTQRVRPSPSTLPLNSLLFAP